MVIVVDKSIGASVVAQITERNLEENSILARNAISTL
jgi:hypothetical protein